MWGLAGFGLSHSHFFSSFFNQLVLVLYLSVYFFPTQSRVPASVSKTLRSVSALWPLVRWSSFCHLSPIVGQLSSGSHSLVNVAQLLLSRVIDQRRPLPLFLFNLRSLSCLVYIRRLVESSVSCDNGIYLFIIALLLFVSRNKNC